MICVFGMPTLHARERASERLHVNPWFPILLAWFGTDAMSCPDIRYTSYVINDETIPYNVCGEDL